MNLRPSDLLRVALSPFREKLGAVVSIQELPARSAFLILLKFEVTYSEMFAAAREGYRTASELVAPLERIRLATERDRIERGLTRVVLGED